MSLFTTGGSRKFQSFAAGVKTKLARSARAELEYFQQFILILAQSSSCPKPVAFRCPHKAPGDWRSPKRSADFKHPRTARSVLDCGGPPPLFSEAAGNRANVKGKC
jgi:hypothetical protein